MLIPLLDGAYQAKSVIAANQRCVNLYPEVNQLYRGSMFPQPITQTQTTHYPTPGLTRICAIGSGPIRCLYTASNGDLYAVSGTHVYYVNKNWAYTDLGQITTSTGQVYIADNGTTAVLVDGSVNGYAINLSTHAMTAISDPAFYGSDGVTYIDTYLVFNKPGTSFFYSTLSNQVTPFDGTYIAGKEGFVDNIVRVVSMHNELWLIGTQTTEIWNNVGGTLFPFARVQGSYIQQGCIAKDSIAVTDMAVCWLSQNTQGERMVLMGQPYAADRISTHAIEEAISKYDTVSDAVGFIYQQQGHTFYVLTFPSANATWVCDITRKMLQVGEVLWHERAYTDANGNLNRIRPNCVTQYNGITLVGDWETGYLYKLDPTAFTDDGQPITRIRSFPTFQNELKRVQFNNFTADMDVGEATFGIPGPSYLWTGTDYIVAANNATFIMDQGAITQGESNLQVGLRWADDGGKNWGVQMYRSLGAVGETLTNPIWRRLGMGRKRVFELRWSAPVFTALNGAYVDVTPAAT